jgi:hypothetical protein
MEDVDDETIAKPSELLRHTLTLVAWWQPFVVAAAARIDPKENGKNHVLNRYSL